MSTQLRASHPEPADEFASGVGHSMRHAGALVLQRGLHLVAAAGFAVLVPRMMGPHLLGQYALLTSASFWFALLSGLGAVSMITRSVPRMLAAGDVTAVNRLATSLVVLRGGTGIVTASAYALVMIAGFGFGDLVAVLFIAGAIWARTVGNVTYSLFLGLNKGARWGAGDLVRRWLTLIFVLIGVPLGGLRGACAGFFAANVVVLLLGLVQARAHLNWKDLDLSREHLGPHLRLGTAYAAGNLMLALSQRSGESLTRITTSEFAEVGFYGAAFSIYLTIGQALWQLAVSFAPLLIAEEHAGRTHNVSASLQQLAKWMVIAMIPVSAGAWLLGPVLVPIVLGARYAPVAENLVPLTLTLITLAVASTGRVAALTIDRPGMTASAAAAELSVFWILGAALGSRWGSAGVSWAALCASAVYATVMTLRVRRHLSYSLREPAVALLSGILFLPVGLLNLGWPSLTIAFILACACYGATLWSLQIVTRSEFRQLLRQALPGRRCSPVDPRRSSQ